MPKSLEPSQSSAPEEAASANPFAYHAYRGLARHQEQRNANAVQEQTAQESPSGQEGRTLLAATRQKIREALKGRTANPTSPEQTPILGSSATEMTQALEREIEAARSAMTKEELAEEEDRATRNMSTFYRAWYGQTKTLRTVEASIDDFIRGVYAAGLQEDPEIWRELDEVKREANAIRESIHAETRKTPEAFLTNGLLRLREYKRQFQKNGLMLTPELERLIPSIRHDARRKLEGTNGVVTLLGPTGSGKTVIAKMLARDLSPNGEFEFVSAHSRMAPEDLLTRLGISVDTIQPEDVPQLTTEAVARFKKQYPNLASTDAESYTRKIEEAVQAQAGQRVIRTQLVLESVMRAAKNGTKVVIDEFNYLPPETIASLNNILATKKGATFNITVGDKMVTETIKDGFGIILTGNIGKEYLKRQELDPAFINRILTGVVEYKYPPQEINDSLHDSVLSAEESDAAKATKSRDLFVEALTQLVDEKANLKAPADTLEKTWDLTRVFSIIQRISDGEDIRKLGLSNAATQGNSEYQFKRIFLSFRNLNAIVREWKLEGYQKPLDWYVYDNLIRPAETIAPAEAAQIYSIFKLWGGFFADKEWQGLNVDGAAWRMHGQAPSPGAWVKQSTPLKFFLPSEIVTAAMGEDMPYPVAEEQKETQHNEQFEAEMFRQVEEMEAQLKSYDFIHRICGEVTAEPAGA